MPRHQFTPQERRRGGLTTAGRNATSDGRRKGGKRAWALLLRTKPDKARAILALRYGLEWEERHDATADAERAATRRAYPLDGIPCADGCGRPATERDHTQGLAAGHGPGLIAPLAHTCHVSADVARMRAQWRAQDSAPPTDDDLPF